MKANTFFSDEEKQRITSAIKEAETNTSGEIRVHIETTCGSDPVLDRAAYIFEKLGIYKTAQRNGVLFYLAIKDKKFAILGDAGINNVVAPDFWVNIKDTMSGFFKEQRFADGLTEGIKMAGMQLKTHFPYQRAEDVNELPDEISWRSDIE